MAENITPGESGQKILSFDIGGSNIKAVLLDAAGQNLTEYEKLATPVPATPNG
jgi:polyphosphate glucokinase